MTRAWVYTLTADEVRTAKKYARGVIAAMPKASDQRHDPNEERRADLPYTQACEFGGQYAVTRMFGIDFDWEVRQGYGDHGIDFIWRGYKVDVKWSRYTHPTVALIVPAECKALPNADVFAFSTDLHRGQHFTCVAHGVISVRRFWRLRDAGVVVWSDKKNPHPKATAKNDCWVLDVVKKHLKSMDGFYNIEPKGAHRESVALDTTTP